MRNHPALFSAMYRFFGSYHDACELAGLAPLRGRNRASRLTDRRGAPQSRGAGADRDHPGSRQAGRGE
jgi:hypothetical protein